MAGQNHKTQIKVQIDDKDAQQHLDTLLKKARQLAQIMSSVQVQGAPPTRSTAAGGGGAPPMVAPQAAPVQAPTTSTAPAPGAPPAPAAPGASPAPTPPAPPTPQPAFRSAEYGMGYRIGAAGAGYLQAGGMSLLGGRNDPAYAVKQTGRILEEVMERTSQGMLNLANSIDLMGGSTPIVSDLIGMFASGLKISKAMAAVGMTVMAESVEARMDKIMALQRMERPGEMGRALSGGDRALHQRFDVLGEGYGFQAGEVAQFGAQFAQSIGAAGSLNDARMQAMFQMALSGINTAVAGRFIGLGGPGGGATQGLGGAFNALGGTIGVAEQAMGMRGSKTDEALARIAAHTQQMAEQGMALDLESVNRLALGLHRAGGRRAGQTGGRNVFAGMHGFRGALRMSQMAGGARQQFGGQFGGLADAAIQAYAFQNADNPLDALAIMEQMAGDPDMVRQVVGGMLGQEAGALAFAGKGFSAEQARVLADPSTRAARGTPRSYGSADPGTQALNRAFAQEEGKLLRSVAADPSRLNEALIKAMYTINTTLVQDLSPMGAELVRKLDGLTRWLANK